MAEEAKIVLHRGLRDVYMDRTWSSFIDGKAGKLLYRGYNIHDLAKHSTFEEVIYLLLYAALPTRSQLGRFETDLKSSRLLRGEIVDVIRVIKDAHPMDVLRTAVSAMASFDPEVDDVSRDATLRKGVRLTAKAPVVVAAHVRIRDGKAPIDPRDDLNQAANFLWMLTGQEPDKQDAALLDKDFVLHAEHGANASSFGARVTASTGADLHSAVVTGIAVLKGPSHGGAAEEVMKMALDIEHEQNAEPYVKNLLKNRSRVTGFGHRVYKALDPRAIHLKDDARALGERKGQPQWFSILEAVSNVMEPYSRKGICQNVDFWSGAIYYLLDIPEDLFIPIFAMGRVPGWTAQVLEQYENNILLRPRLAYAGPMDVKYVPIDERV